MRPCGRGAPVVARLALAPRAPECLVAMELLVLLRFHICGGWRGAGQMPRAADEANGIAQAGPAHGRDYAPKRPESPVTLPCSLSENRSLDMLNSPIRGTKRITNPDSNGALFASLATWC